jgi:hypothetical protein
MAEFLVKIAKKQRGIIIDTNYFIIKPEIPGVGHARNKAKSIVAAMQKMAEKKNPSTLTKYEALDIERIW